MHETVFAKQIIDEAERHGKVKSITVEVGGLAHVPGKEMKEVLQARVSYEVKVVEKPAIVKCVCGFEGEPDIKEHGHDHAVYYCPKCGEVPELVTGADIILKEVEIED